MISTQERRQSGTVIRHAVQEDAIEIFTIASAVRLPEAPVGTEGTRGFLIFVPPVDVYAHRLAGSGHSYLASVDREPAGFVLAYHSDDMEAAGKSDDPTVLRIRELTSGPFVYIDQIVVRDTFRGNGLARNLIGAVSSAAEGLPLVAAAAVQPVENTASVRFFRDTLRWERVGSIGLGGVTGDIYRSTTGKGSEI